MGEPLPSGSHPQPKGEEEEGSPIGDEDMQVNNRVAGGAGKRLSVEDLQVQTDCYCTLTLLLKANDHQMTCFCLADATTVLLD